jgi:hypothetical protein
LISTVLVDGAGADGGAEVVADAAEFESPDVEAGSGADDGEL